ncbi:MAG: hypothetical protein H0X53_04365, partial [Sphingomonas sp.]|nr:hypothetical protein [Sphingomonas sp.]
MQSQLSAAYPVPAVTPLPPDRCAPAPAPECRLATRLQGRLVIAGLLLLLLSIIIKSAWLGDDFYIGVRSFDNLLNGYGLRWNVLDRVQVFTDPL